MLPIIDERISKVEERFQIDCLGCGKTNQYTTKAAALRALERQNCRHCKKDYRSIPQDIEIGIYQNPDKKWCSTCSGCGCEQAYTRKDHAKQSSIADWQCKKCVAEAKGFSKNKPVGNKTRLFNKFSKMANSRKIEWNLTEKQMFSNYIGKCALTNWDISINHANCTASLDRIDSNKGYIIGNVQWVHTIVNMSKNKYGQDTFISMCKAVARNT